jgi:glycosyltransferase involved in cell wall biosynthesis
VGRGPRAVVGVPIRDHVDHLPQALETLLAQTEREYVVVVVDDSDSDEPGRLVRAVAAGDPRVNYHRNERRLGLVGNWRRAFTLARAAAPGAPYFAWGSDHDVWEPRWLAALCGELDERPTAVLAYSLNDAISESGDSVRPPWRFATGGEDASARFVHVLRRMVAGDMVYGLFRAAALEACGVLRDVLMPDRLLLAELSLHGEFRQVPELLWHRRLRARAVDSPLKRGPELFPDGRSSALPWWLDHARVLARAKGVGVAVAYAGLVPALHVARRVHHAVDRVAA